MYQTTLSLSVRLAVICAASLAAAPAFAQQVSDSSATATAQDVKSKADSDAKNPITSVGQVVVTGRLGSGVRTKAATSYSVTRIEEETLRLQAPTSVTESLKSVPGFWVEASGGEGSGNVRARGIPVDGFGSVTILEDGVPVVHDPSLGYLNGDQAFRLDETIERVEVVRGGPSSVTYSNAPAGAINYVPRRVGDREEVIGKLTFGDYGLRRADVYYGAPLRNGWSLSAGGFLREDDGIRSPGFKANRGGQFRFNVSRDLERGRLSLDYKHLNDRNILFLAIPMRTYGNGDIRAVPGFDGNDGTLAGPETRFLAMKMPRGGLWDFDNGEGTHVTRDQFRAKFDYELGQGWTIANAFGYSKTATTRNGVFGLSLVSASKFLQDQSKALAGQIRAIPGASGLNLSYVNGGQAFNLTGQNGNGLVVVGGLRGLVMPISELINDFRISRHLEFGDQKHQLTAGYYFANTREDFDRYSSNVLLDVQNQARLLNLNVVDASGKVLTTLTDQGVSRYGYEWGNASGESTTHAFSLADEWQISPALRFDVGLRWERIATNGWAEVRTSANGGTPATSNMLTGSGRFVNYDLVSSKLGWTAGFNYQFARNSGLFGRWTSAFRLPSLGSYLTRSDSACDGKSGSALDACVASEQAKAGDIAITQTMDLAEIGYKFAGRQFGLYATGFYTQYDNVGFSNYVFDVNTGASTQQQGYANTKTYGLELEGNWYPTPWFDVAMTATLQRPTYEGLKFIDGSNLPRDYSGHQLIRVPRTSARIVPGVNLLDGKLRLQLAYEYQGERFVDTANSVRLPSYKVLNFTGRWELDPRWSLYLYADNLRNSMGLTEGNPRAGELESADKGANTFLARPILGRAYRMAVMYRF